MSQLESLVAVVPLQFDQKVHHTGTIRVEWPHYILWPGMLLGNDGHQQMWHPSANNTLLCLTRQVELEEALRSAFKAPSANHECQEGA